MHQASKMDTVLRHSSRWSLSLMLLFYRGIPSAFFICSLDFIAPQRQKFWCVHDDAPVVTGGSVLTSFDSWLSEADRNVTQDECRWRNPAANNTWEDCHKWIFDTSDEFGRTFTSEFSAVCDRQWLRAWAQSALMFGMMLGNLLFSHVSDWYGRRTTCLLSHLCILFCGIACSVAPTFSSWIVLRILLALGLGGNQNGPFTLGMESSDASQRALLALADSFGWVFGMIILSAFPALIHDWRYLQFAISLSTLPMLTMAWFVDESPRWLVATDRLERARGVLRRLLRRNGMPHADEDVDALLTACVSEHRDRTRDELQHKTTLLDLVRTPRRLLTTSSFYVHYPLNILVYYNLLYFIVGLDTKGIFSNLLWAGIFEIPTLPLVFLLVRSFKRRHLHLICNTPPIIACALLYLSPSAFGAGVVGALALATVAKMGVQVGFSVLGVHVNELYPTRVRGIALGSCITVSRLGAIAAPFTSQQVFTDPNIVNSIGCLVSLVVALPLRETFGKSLPDDFEDSSPSPATTSTVSATSNSAVEASK